jgi:glutaconyl-CoA/methylmalonyl-CoA decarboxylase subunit gamma
VKKFKVTVDGQTYTVQVEEMANDTTISSINKVEKTGVKVSSADNETKLAKVSAPVAEQPKETQKPAAVGGMIVKAPMPGSVLEVKVKEGDTVKDGDVLLVLEAMKMENELTASQAGTVTEILVKKGDTVNSGDPLIVLA